MTGFFRRHKKLKLASEITLIIVVWLLIRVCIQRDVVGGTAPAFSGKLLDGVVVRLEEFQGPSSYHPPCGRYLNITLIEYWHVWPLAGHFRLLFLRPSNWLRVLMISLYGRLSTPLYDAPAS